MSSSLYRLGRAMAAARWKVVAVWTVLMVAVGALAVGLGGSFSTAFEIPGTEAQAGIDSLDTRFPEMAGASGQIVFLTEDGSAVDDQQDAIDAVMEQIADVPDVEVAPSPFDETSPGIRDEAGTAIIAQVQMDGQIGDYSMDSVEEIQRIVDDVAAEHPGLEARLGGTILQSAEIPFGIGEVVGILLALIILAVVFRSFVPAAIPIVTAVVGVGISMMALMALASGLEIPSVTTSLGAMLGLAVGIDYALFILSRHRDQLARGADVRESVGEALATSGSAVIFAGLTVIVALVGLFVTGIPFLTVMGVAAAGTVALSVVVALTLLPAIMGILGERLRPRRIRRLMAEHGGTLPEEHADSVEGSEEGGEADGEGAGERATQSATSLGARWVRLVTKVPAVTILLVVLALGSLAIPLKDLELALPDQGTEEVGTPARDTYDLIAERFGPGYNGPLLVTADIINTDDPLQVVEDLEAEIAAMDDVREIQIATPNRGADLAVISVIPEGGPTEQSTKDLVQALRDAADGWEEEHGISDITVTGAAAVGIDTTDKLSAALLPFGILVVGLSLILLALVFRSVWVPIKASLGYLLSVGAAFGVTAMVFEYGWFNAPLNVTVNGPVVAFMPIMVMGVLFGLAMDYEVFLVSRMREEYVRTGDARGAIERGFTGSAPVVIAAALIMTSVFAGFVTSGWFMLQPIAVALAVGVLVDAFVVRMTLVPAVLALLGDRAWWLPGWLDRLLPTVDVEGEGLAAVLEHRHWTEIHGETALRLEDTVAPLIGADGTLGPLTGAVSPGTLLLVRSPDDAARRTFLELASGRLQPISGLLALHDSLAPDDLGAMQAQVHRIGEGEDMIARITGIERVERAGTGRDVHAVVVIDDAADLARPAVLAAGAVDRLEGLLRDGAAVIVGSPGDDDAATAEIERAIIDRLDDPARCIALRVERSHPVDTASAAVPGAASDHDSDTASEGALA
ncbi:MMPL family transporter [Brachybacterium sp. DNPG3]